MKRFMICYFYWSGNISSGFGDAVTEIGENEDIYTVDKTNAIKEAIIKKCNYTGCSIQNIIPLND